MKQTRLNIVTKTDNYPIIIGSNLTSSVSKIFVPNPTEVTSAKTITPNTIDPPLRWPNPSRWVMPKKQKAAKYCIFSTQQHPPRKTKSNTIVLHFFYTSSTSTHKSPKTTWRVGGENPDLKEIFKMTRGDIF